MEDSAPVVIAAWSVTEHVEDNYDSIDPEPPADCLSLKSGSEFEMSIFVFTALPQKLGVSLEFLLKFCADHAYYDGFSYYTTADICRNIVLTETIQERVAYIDLYRGQCDEDGVPYFSPATVYVSHAWSGYFRDLVDVAGAYQRDHRDSYFFVDLFCNNQNVHPRWLPYELKAALRATGELLVVMAPFHDPLPFQRTWCLFELMTAVELQVVAVTMKLPETYFPALLDELRSGSNQVARMPSIAVEYSLATSEEERGIIHSAIESTSNFGTFNAGALAQAQLWMVQTLQVAVLPMMQGSPTEDGAQMLQAVGVAIDALRMPEDAVTYYDKAALMHAALQGHDRYAEEADMARVVNRAQYQQDADYTNLDQADDDQSNALLDQEADYTNLQQEPVVQADGQTYENVTM